MTGGGVPGGVKYRIGILEDSPRVRDYFIDIVAEADDLELVGTATRISEVADMLTAGPQLVLTDLGLPDGSGLEIIPVIKATGAQALVITAFGDRETVLGALEAGADGYLLKDSSAELILDSIRVTLDGGAPISAAAAVYLLERFRAGAAAAGASEFARADPEKPLAQPAMDERLTPREAELLTLFSRGHSYKSAARELGISPLTVGGHVKVIYRKLSVNSRGEAVFAAVQGGLLSI